MSEQTKEDVWVDRTVGFAMFLDHCTTEELAAWEELEERHCARLASGACNSEDR